MTKMKLQIFPIRSRNEGYYIISMCRELYGKEFGDNIKMIDECSYNVPIYDYFTNDVVGYYPVINELYLLFPEKIGINFDTREP